MEFATKVLQKMLLESPSDEHFDVRLIVEGSDTNSSSKSGAGGGGGGGGTGSGTCSGGGGETVLRAHRIVLSTVSDVFRKMFASGLREHNEGVVRIPDFSPAAVAEALTLIYGGELDRAKNDWQLAGQVWDFGHRFKVDHISALARSAALEQLSQDNCLRMLGFSLYIGDDAAVQRIRDFVSDETNFSVVVQSAEFTMTGYEVICSIRRPPAGSFVEQDVLTFEKVWFDSLVAWSDNVPHDKKDDDAARNVKREDRLAKALRLVDFNRMRTHELRECKANRVAGPSVALATQLVGVLLSRCEKLEGNVVEKERELDDLGAAYQVALLGKNEAERSARIADERFQKATGRMSREDIKNVRRRVGSPSGNSNDGMNDFMPVLERMSSATPHGGGQYSSNRRRGSSAGASPVG